MKVCTSTIVSDGSACATMASAREGTLDRSGQCSGRHSFDLTMHFEQCMKASSTVTTSTRFGALPLTASRACKVGSHTILPLPLTRVAVAWYDEDQRHLETGKQVLEGVETMIAWSVWDRERLVIEDGDETRRITLG
jgi:hypothetical protein